MDLVVLEGLIIFALVLTGLRVRVFTAIPEPLKYAIGVGIGLFIALIGLVDAGIVRAGVPLISFGVNGALRGWPTVAFVFGLLLMTVPVAKRVRGAILIGILASAALARALESVLEIGPFNDGNPDTANDPVGWALNAPRFPDTWFSTPDLSILGQFSLTGAFAAVGVVTASLFVFSLLLTDFFDTIGTATALAHEAELTDEDDTIPHLESILLVDAAATAVGGAASVSSNTSYIESAADIGAGIVTHTILQIATGKTRQIPGLLWIVSAAFVVFFAIDPVTTLLDSITG